MRILLHICCGPCAVYSIKRLREKNGKDSVEGFFYNPNIHPLSEYLKRKESALKMSEVLGFKINFFKDFEFDDFFKNVTPYEKEKRCHTCWALRLSETAEYAARNGFDGFTTTLLISPHQNHQEIKDIAKVIADRRSVAFVYEDFRSGFKESHATSKEMGLYHQNYCGCLYSESERHEKVVNR
jgi:predicted adenine nucleotide alpha hydrolase (AANH) superfamily ATPase